MISAYPLSDFRWFQEFSIYQIYKAETVRAQAKLTLGVEV